MQLLSYLPVGLAPTVLKPFIKVIIVKKKSSIDQTSDMYSLQTDEDIHEDPMRSRVYTIYI